MYCEHNNNLRGKQDCPEQLDRDQAMSTNKNIIDNDYSS